MANLKISEVWVYPVKSCAGIKMESAKVAETGFAHDREWMIVDENHHFVTQRQNVNLAFIKPRVFENERGEATSLELNAEGMETIQVEVSETGRVIESEVWGNGVVTVDQGEEVSSWLSKFLSQKVFLVKMKSDYKRLIKEKYRQAGNESTGFADALPFLLISEASLEDLNGKLKQKNVEALGMDRFRPNIVVSGGSAFQEDVWKKIKVQNKNGDTHLRVVKPCARCEITTTNQDTGERKEEPLKTLGEYRSKPKGIMFGQNCVQVEVGNLISVGDAVEIIE